MNNLSDYKYPEFNEDFEGMVPANGGGGSNIMRVTFSFNEETETIVCDKTFEEITTAIQNGDYVYGFVDADGASVSEFIDVDKIAQRYVCFSKCQIIPTTEDTCTKDYIVYHTLTVRVDNVVSSTVARHPLS